MGTRKIKIDRKGTPKLHGQRQARMLEAGQKKNTRLLLREQVRRRRLTRKDSLGEEYILARFALRNKNDGERYTAGMTKALAGISPKGTEHVVAI